MEFFKRFRNITDMLDAIERARKIADTHVKYWQTKIFPGDYFIQNTEYGFLIFGQVLEAEDAFYSSEQGKNYRFCKCYSVVCVDGEMGDVHVSVITLLISKETFLRFKEKNWVVEDGDSLT